jgi:hypothetical protein
MNDKNTEMATEEPKGISGDLASELSQLSADVQALAKSASRAWKTTALVFVILLAIIAGYLYAIVYKPLKGYAQEPDTIVQIGVTAAMEAANSQLRAHGIADVPDADLHTWLATEAKRMAPGLVEERIKPLAEEQLANLPELRQQLTEQLKVQAPDLRQKAVAFVRDDALPRAREALMNEAQKQTDQALDQLNEGITAMVIDLVESTQENQALMSDADSLQKALEDSIEEQMGPTLDMMFEAIDNGLEMAKFRLGEMLDAYGAGRITDQVDMLEFRIVQLTVALFQELGQTMPVEGTLTDIVPEMPEL